MNRRSEANPSQMNHGIAGVLFDVGGVLVNVEGAPYLARLLGIEATHEMLYERWMASPSVVAHETGRMDAAAFASGVIADLGLPVSAERFLHDFVRWPTGLLPGALELLDAIRKGYQVAALSNTSAAHWERIDAMGFLDRFERTYLSHEIGWLKPDAQAYEAALEGMGLPASRVLFLDDSRRNVEAAATLGLRAHLARGPREARQVLVEYGIVPPAAGG